MGANHLNAIVEIAERQREEKRKFSKLRDKLLAIGGTRVVGDFDEDLDKMLNRGEVFTPKKVKSVKMQPCRCHGNSGVFWKNYSEANGFDNIQIVTGYCLSNDGLWRSHSFLYQPMDNIVIETTVKRKVYFGFSLNIEESEEHHDNNH